MTNPNDAIYPREPYSKQGIAYPAEMGLSKREYFAAMAMQGMMTIHPHELVRCPSKDQTVGEWIALNSVSMADALIEELSK